MTTGPALLDAATRWNAWPVGYGEKLSEGMWRGEEFHELFAEELMVAVKADGPRRLIINVPPRHGKTEGISHWGSTWFLDWWPRLRVVLAMYAAELAGEVGASVRDTIRENPDVLDVRVRRDSSARNRWNTTKRGGFVATGVGGILTGRGGSLLIVDDPIKNWEEANSQVYRQRTWDWYLSTFRTRIEPGPDGGDGCLAVVMTRWHEDDLTGRLIREQGTQDQGGLWRHICIPAIAERDDPLGRDPGSALSVRYPIERLEETRDELGPHIFGALYQQHPTAPAGTVFKRGWWKRWDTYPRGKIDRLIATVDCTFKDTDDSDFVVIQVWAKVGAYLFLMDCWRRQADFETTCRALAAMKARWPECGEWIVEEAANGAAVIQTMRKSIPGVLPYRPRESKHARAMACQPSVAAGQWWLPSVPRFTPLLDDDPTHLVNGKRVPFALSVEDYIEELAAFPNGTHDDMVDATTMAGIHLGVAAPILTSHTWQDERLGDGRGR